MPRGRRHYRISFDDALVAHETALRHGGRVGILNPGLVQSAIARPYSGYYRSIQRKAAALLHALARNHGFADGNKRTCLLLVHLLLDRSGFTLHAPSLAQLNAELEQLIVDSAEGRKSVNEIAAWFEKRVRPRVSV